MSAERLLPKPAYGSPCNSCGLCCLAEQCPLSEAMFGRQRVCPALEKGAEGRLVCGLVANTTRYASVRRWPEAVVREAFLVLIGGDAGCDAPHPAVDSIEHIQRTRPGLLRKAEAAVRDASAPARELIRFLQGD